MSVSPGAYRQIGIIGAGAWGTALAIIAAFAGCQVRLWGRNGPRMEEMARRRSVHPALPGIRLPDAVVPTGELAEVCTCEALLLAVPAQHLRSTILAMKPFVRPGLPAVVCAKGIELESGLLMNEVLQQSAPDLSPAMLSGPSFARDVALGLPTAVTIAAQTGIAERLQGALGSSSFRPYVSDDLIGVALGGAAKNVYAIACGIVEGLHLGESARAALLARAFAELTRLGEALGARRETLMGLSGLGDLVLTATSRTSRNFSRGIAIGERRSGSPHTLAEGVYTAPALVTRAQRHGIELPIAEAVADILSGNLALELAEARLMQRPLKAE